MIAIKGSFSFALIRIQWLWSLERKPPERHIIAVVETLLCVVKQYSEHRQPKGLAIAVSTYKNRKP